MIKVNVVWLQATLNVRTGANLRVDGILGPRTKETYGRLAPNDQHLVQSLATTLGIELEVDPPLPRTDGWLSMADLEPHINEAAIVTGVPVAHIRALIDVEAERRTSQQGTLFNPRSQMGSFSGLTQMGTLAWQDAREFLGGILPPYEEAKYDPRWSILAGAAYNARWAGYYRDSLGDDPSFAVRYALHNQGPGFIARSKRNLAPINYAGQSRTARELLDAARNEVA